MRGTIYIRRLVPLAIVVLVAGVAFAPSGAAEHANVDLEINKDCRNITADRGTGDYEAPPPEPQEEIYVGPGDRVECTVVVTNQGPGEAHDVQMIDTMSPRIRVEGEPQSAEFTCEVSHNEFRTRIHCEDPAIAEGESSTVTYVLRMPSDMRPGESFVNRALTFSDNSDTDNSDNADSNRFGVEGCDEGVDARGASRGVSITGTRGPDIICGSRFGDSINGLGGADVIFAYGGNDAVNGGTGNDYINGGTGNDAIRGGPGRDRIVGGPGRDACRGEARTGC